MTWGRFDCNPKLCILADIGEELFGIVDGLISSNELRAIALDVYCSGIFGRFSSNFVFELIFGRSGLGLYMGEFRQISTKLLPLVYVENLFLSSILGIFLYDSLQTLYMG